MRYTESELADVLRRTSLRLEEVSDSKITGSGISSFVYAKTPLHAIEFSYASNGIWIEFFVVNEGSAHHDEMYATAELAIRAAITWLVGENHQSKE